MYSKRFLVRLIMYDLFSTMKHEMDPTGSGLSVPGTSSDVPSLNCPPLLYRSAKHSRLALEKFNEMRAEGCLCDVTLVVVSHRINAHRLVLASCSNYFRAMFTSEMAESRQRMF